MSSKCLSADGLPRDYEKQYDEKLWHGTFAATPQLLMFRERPEAPETQVITFTDRAGIPARTAGRPGNFRGVAISAGGKGVAVTCDDPDMQVCLIHPDGSVTRISAAPFSYTPAWSPAGDYLVYGTHRGAGRYSLVLKDARLLSRENA